MTVKAIQTRYAGCHFRSRIEARWAVFFDRLGIEWEYEPEGFDLPSGRYLPDFLLTSMRSPDTDGVWWGVKGLPPTREERNLAWELFDATDRLVYISSGQIPRDHLDGSRVELIGGTRERFSLRGGRLALIPDVGIFDQSGVAHPTLIDAYKAARSARFEHGESGAA